MTEKPPLTAAEHIDRAKTQLANGWQADYAIAHALVAIAELMATNMTDIIIDATARGALATAEAVGSIFNVVGIPNPGPNITHPCPVKSAGGRTCIHPAGHLPIHEDGQGWGWLAAGDHAHPMDRDE
jgi:hypothetical protein